MKHTISETTRPNGVKVQLWKNGETYIVKNYYKDGSQRDCKFFGMFSSAVYCYNVMVENANAKAEGGE